MADAKRKETRDQAPISSVPVSGEVLRPPCVLLVGIEPGEEPEDLALARQFVQVACIRRPLLACTRMSELRPEVVLLGSRIKPLDFVLLRRCASEIDATIVQLGPLIERHLADWLSSELDAVRLRRSRRDGSSQDV
jgi:hypothetical protein